MARGECVALTTVLCCPRSHLKLKKKSLLTLPGKAEIECSNNSEYFCEFIYGGIHYITSLNLYSVYSISRCPSPNQTLPKLPEKYEMCPAVKKLYQLHPKVSASSVAVASRVVNQKHDELRPAVSKELRQLHRKIWVYKMSNNWKLLTQFYCTLLYIQ
jgi:hypothetical protein